MREIKFRAWNEELKRMAYTSDKHWKTYGWWGAVLFAGDDVGETLMQSTGLKDKNGNDVFEGDIVLFQITDKYDHKTQVTWQEYGAWDYGLGKPEEIEVIGNVYETPDLITTT